MKVIANYPNGYKIFSDGNEFRVVVATTKIYESKFCGTSRREAELQIRHHQKNGKWF